ncbi:uncharacterized protein G2W53_014185 [Senna tora]|uniref:Uncharacterized protein n=1 Tax=Senna tora TaxID=362788 RepID=A0A834WT20_9FABA|nr:uncharacterized protein G2W53_014185 [Senna tora]
MDTETPPQEVARTQGLTHNRGTIAFHSFMEKVVNPVDSVRLSSTLDRMGVQAHSKLYPNRSMGKSIVLRNVAGGGFTMPSPSEEVVIEKEIVYAAELVVVPHLAPS